MVREELFTYIRVFGSLAHPRVFPLFVIDKLLAKEVAYQTVGKGLTKFLKDAKKFTWPCFPISCVTYTLENFKNSSIEIDQIRAFNFPTILNRPYDPHGVGEDDTTQDKLKPFLNEPDKLDDLFGMVLEYYMVEKLAAYHLSLDELIRFNQYHQQRIAHFHKSLLNKFWKNS